MLSETKYKAKHEKGLKILTPQQMLQRLPITLAQVKAGNTSETLLNEFRQIIYSLHIKLYSPLFFMDGVQLPEG